MSAVLDAEERRWEAMIGNDFDALDELVHADLTYTHSNANVDTKASWIKTMVDGVVDYQAVERSDTAVRERGDMAVITGAATFTVHAMGRDITINSRYSAVWVNEDGRWQFYNWQNTPVPA